MWCVQLSVERFGDCVCWWCRDVKPFEKAVRGVVSVTLTVVALPWGSATVWALLAAVSDAPALPAPSLPRVVVQLQHFEGTAGLQVEWVIRGGVCGLYDHVGIGIS